MDPSNIPVTVSTNFSYSFLPSEAASAYAPPPGSNSGIVGSISSFVGNVRDSLSAIGSTVGEFSAALTLLSCCCCCMAAAPREQQALQLLCKTLLCSPEDTLAP